MKYNIKNNFFREKLENLNINKFDIYNGEFLIMLYFII